MIGWIIVAVGTVATLWTICASIYWTIWPGETEPDHPKNIILRSDR
jgi:hypothetical protein